MPRWARFLSCTFTGLLIALTGFLLVAYAQEGRPDFWRQLQEFLTTPAFWTLVWVFTGLAALSLLLGRVLVNLYGLWGSLSGFLAGGALAVAYLTFLLSTQVEAWGGLMAALPRLWPSAGVMAMPLAIAGALTTWLWDRFE